MVAQIDTGKSVRGMLKYNENKVESGKAKLILASGFATEIDRLNLNQKVQRFRNLTQLNGRVKTNAMHISLNFHNDDKLDLSKLQQIASAYMEQIGYGDQPYIAYQHFDAAHPHLHIATTIIQSDGKRKPTHDIGRLISEPARKQIEKQFGLIAAEGRKQLEPLNIRPALYGKIPTKQAINAVVSAVMKNYSFTSMAEFNAVLAQFNVIADRESEDTLMFEKKGLLYSILDGKGKKNGVPIKASSFYCKPTFANLEKRFASNIEKRKPLRENLKAKIDGAIQLAGSDSQGFEQALAKQHIAILYRKNLDGIFYGVTYIDHAQKTVFNGSHLGKRYSAKCITAGFASPQIQQAFILQEQTSALHFQITNPLTALLEKPAYGEPAVISRKKKKKKGKSQQQNV